MPDMCNNFRFLIKKAGEQPGNSIEEDIVVENLDTCNFCFRILSRLIFFMNHRYRLLACMLLLFPVCSFCQMVNVNEGPVNYITEYDGRGREEEYIEYWMLVTRGLPVKKGDGLYMKMSDANPISLFLTKYRQKISYFKEQDSIHPYRLNRVSSFESSDTVVVWGESETGQGARDNPKGPNANPGLYVMHYRAEKDVYAYEDPLFRRISYMLNHFYSDALFLVNSKIDSTNFLFLYSLKRQIREGYQGYATIERSEFDRFLPWSCRTIGWYGPAMTKDGTQKELNSWKEEFKGVKNATFEVGGLSGGLKAISYIIPVDKNLCKFPEYGICEGRLSKAPGRILISIVPEPLKQKGYFQIHWYIKAI